MVLSLIREQLWAEAVYRYGKGERANLPYELWAEQAAVNEEFRDRDERREETVLTAIADLKEAARMEQAGGLTCHACHSCFSQHFEISWKR